MAPHQPFRQRIPSALLPASAKTAQAVLNHSLTGISAASRAIIDQAITMAPQKPLHHLLSSALFPAGAKTTQAVFTYSLEGISDIGRAIIDQAVLHPWIFGITAALIVGGILFITVPIIVGFGPLGPIKGSIASLWQSWIGNVVEGSLFAVLQSLGMKGVFATVGEAMLAAGASGVGIMAAAHEERKKGLVDGAAKIVAQAAGEAGELVTRAAGIARTWGSSKL